jgi:Peptidase family M1 domain
MKLSSFRLILLFSFLLAGCSARVPSTPVPGKTSLPLDPSPVPMTMSPTTGSRTSTSPEPSQPSITPQTTPGNTLSATLPFSQDSQIPTTYTLSVELDYANHFVVVKETIDFLNRSQDFISQLVLINEPSRYPAVFHLNEMSLEGDPRILDYSQEIGFLYVNLSSPIEPSQSILLNLIYELRLPSPDPVYYGRPVPFGYSDSQTNLVDWYPFLPPYQSGRGWQINKASYFGEYLVYPIADFLIDLHLVDKRQNLVVAASSLPTEKEDSFFYQFDNARNFVFSISDQYQVSSTQVGDVLVQSYYFPVHTQAGQAALQATADSLTLYSKIFSPYPHASISVVEADFLDGMEYDGLYFLSKGFYNLYTGTPAEYLIAIAAHETAHAWWYALVGNDQAIEPWLDEALSTYSEKLFYERFHPDALDWWWTYRINYYEPKGWVNGSVYNPEGYRAYRDAVYLNGALFMEDLRQLIGDSSFFSFISDYATHYSYEIATSTDFFSLLNQHTSIDFSSLVGKYFQGQ